MSAPFFSVITPVHNNAATIMATIESVQGQTFSNWEIIVVDDNSQDESWTIANRSSEMDKRIRVYKNYKSPGANSCRNIGIEGSEGQYLIFLDADDIILPACLEMRALAIAAQPSVDMLISTTTFFDPVTRAEKGIFRCPNNVKYKDIIAQFLKHNILWTTTGPSWKRSFLESIGGWDERYPRLQDVELNIRAMLASPVLAFSPKPDSYLYRGEFTLAKKGAAFIGFNLLLREYYKRLMLNNDDDCEVYSDAFSALVLIILKYWNNLKIKTSDEWGAFFINTIREIMDDAHLEAICSYLQLGDAGF